MSIIIIALSIYFIKKYNIKLTRKEIILSFLCLFLFYSNLCLLGLNNRQEQIIKKYQEILTKYDIKIDLIYDDIKITKILLETENKNNSKIELIKALEEYFSKQH